MNNVHLHWQITNDQQRSSARPLLSVVIPIFNEESTVREVLNQIFGERTDKEIIVVDDGSKDGTAEAIESWLQELPILNEQTHRIVWLQHSRNLGKGMAIRSGLDVARGKYAVAQDADLEVFPSEYAKLLEPLISNQAEFVIGSRSRTATGRLNLHRCGVVALNALVRLLYGYRMSDSACCFKVLKTCDLRRMNLQCERFEFCPEVVAKAARMGLAMVEVEIAYSPRSVAQGKKLQLFRDGFRAMATLFRYCRWTPSETNQDTHETQTRCIEEQTICEFQKRDV